MSHRPMGLYGLFLTRIALLFTCQLYGMFNATRYAGNCISRKLFNVTRAAHKAGKLGGGNAHIRIS
jgi:hypothetical protein